MNDVELVDDLSEIRFVHFLTHFDQVHAGSVKALNELCHVRMACQHCVQHFIECESGDCLLKDLDCECFGLVLLQIALRLEWVEVEDLQVFVDELCIDVLF